MRVIRHQIAITDYQELKVPDRQHLMSVAVSRTDPNMAIDLWSLDRERGYPPERWPAVGIYVVGTGNPMSDRLETDDERFETGKDSLAGYGRKFIGTVVTPSGLVWHVFQGPVMK